LERRHHDVRLDEKAAEDLRYIRETMEQSARFTDVPGRGMVLIGITAAMAALIAAEQSTYAGWIRVWGIEFAVALTIGMFSILHKVRSHGSFDAPARKFVLGLAPALFAGALLTAFLDREDLASGLPGTWLLIFGAAVVAAGAFSVRIVPALGFCFMGLGTVALLGPAAWGDWLLAIGFGGLNIGFGIVIARQYGG
jgi:hypothetical protein